MDLVNFGIDPDILCSTLHGIIEFSDETTEFEKSPRHSHNPSRAYVRDCKARARTPADVKEYPNSYVFEVDMPGIKASDIKVHLEDNNKVLVVSGEKKREKDKEKEEGVIKYVKMERKAGKFMRKFPLPENVNPDAISAVYQDGVLIVTVHKKSHLSPRSQRPLRSRLLNSGYVPSDR